MVYLKPYSGKSEKEKMEINGRLRYIDIAKGIGIVCIILGHLGNPDIDRVVYTFHVPIFYFIMGFFTNDKRSIKEYMEVKFRTLMVPYMLTCLVIILLGTIKGFLDGDAITSFTNWFFASFYGAGDKHPIPFTDLTIPKIGALWFLWASFWGSCFLRISLNLNKFARLVFIVCLFAIGYYSRTVFFFPFSIQAGACATLFMYMGYLLRNSKILISDVSQEVKFFGLLFAVVTWFSFIKDYQSFRLVNCDVGRGVIDIVGCICACSIVILLSKIIDSKTRLISRLLSYFGKYSLLVLCIHIIELNLLPWGTIGLKCMRYGMPISVMLILIRFFKVAFSLICVCFISKISLVRRLYGIKE